MFSSSVFGIKKLLLISAIVIFVIGNNSEAYLNRASEEQAIPSSLTSAFRDVAFFSPSNIVVPTVLEVPIIGINNPYETVLVEQVSNNEIIPSYWYETSQTVAISGRVTDGNGRPLASLLDGRGDTSEFFPASGFVTDVVALNVQLFDTAVISSLTVQLDKNVELPLSIQITTKLPSGMEQVVLAERTLSSQRVTFPVITTNNLQVTITYRQPLRITELIIGEDAPERLRRSGVRFLAQPNESYRIYANHDRVVQIPIGETAGLRDDSGVVVMSPLPLQENHLYVMSDEDGDQVVDELDNCPSHYNPDQSDIDKNNRGDACDDWDRDGVLNYLDNCQNIPNRNQSDEDGDGVGDACDDEESRLTEKYFWLVWLGLGVGFVTIITLFLVVVARRPLQEGEMNDDKE